MLQQGSYSASWFNICLVCALICCGCGRGLAVKASEQSSDHTPYDFFSVRWLQVHSSTSPHLTCTGAGTCCCSRCGNMLLRYTLGVCSVIAELIKLGFSAIQLGFERKRVASAIQAGDATACLPGTTNRRTVSLAVSC
jgi:hypothetical protein